MPMARKRKCPTPCLSDDGIDYDSDKGSTDKPPIVRNAANARERARMRVLSKAFSRLKTTLPWVPADTKLSKLDTLRLASCYIAHLRQILEEDQADCSRTADSTTATTAAGGSPDGPIHPINLTWPFTFNGKVQANSGEIRPRKDNNGLIQMQGKAEVTSS